MAVSLSTSARLINVAILEVYVSVRTARNGFNWRLRLMGMAETNPVGPGKSILFAYLNTFRIYLFKTIDQVVVIERPDNIGFGAFGKND